MKSSSNSKESQRQHTRRHSEKSGATSAWRDAGNLNLSHGGQGGIALWRQIVEDLEADIETGRFREGEQLPTEATLSKRFGVNRHTLRRAIAELSGKGLIEATPGRGTFVRAPRLAYPIGQLTRFSEVIAGSGLEPGGKLLAHDQIEVPPEIADFLGLDQGSEVVELEHLRVADKVPICFVTTWFPAARFAGIADAYRRHNNITSSLAEFGVKTYRRLRTLVTARTANSAEREVLAIGRGAIVMVIDSVNVDGRGRPVQASHTRFAADRVQLVVDSKK